MSLQHYGPRPRQNGAPLAATKARSRTTIHSLPVTSHVTTGPDPAEKRSAVTGDYMINYAACVAKRRVQGRLRKGVF